MTILTLTPRNPANLDRTGTAKAAGLPLLFQATTTTTVNALVPRTPSSP